MAQSQPSVAGFEQTTLLQAPAAGQPDQERVEASLTTFQVPFVANEGRIDQRVAFSASTLAGTVYVTRDGKIVYSLPATGDASPGGRNETRPSWSLTEMLLAGKPRPQGSGPRTTRVSYFIGNDPARFRSDLATYDSVSLGEVWPGVNVRLRARGRTTEKIFVLSPGTHPDSIRIRLAGARSLSVNDAGALVATSGLGNATFTRPVAYQQQGDARREIEVAYQVRGNRYGFHLGNYDPSLPVVIDPLLQSTRLDGPGTQKSYALAIHPTSGEVYVAGYTNSTNFPGTAGGAQPSNTAGWPEAFVAHLSSDLTTLVQATYLGGSGNNRAFALAIDSSSGDVYVAGDTNATDFPGTSGGAQESYHRGIDGFVARLNASLTALVQSTYLGGGGADLILGLVINGSSVYVVGQTDSGNFPGTNGAAQAAYGGAGDAFVARLTSDLKTLVRATYLGGSASESANRTNPTHGVPFACALGSNDVYVAGQTDSPDFPGVSGGAQASFGGVTDGFVARLNDSLTTLIQATYLGGSDIDSIHALQISPTSGDVYIAGVSEKSSTAFPGTTGGAQEENAGQADAVIARLTPDLKTLLQSTYLGGVGADDALGLAIHPASGDVYIAGSTRGPGDSNFPGTANGVQSTTDGGYWEDAFAAHLDPTLTTLDQATYLGGYLQDQAFAIAIDPAGYVYVSGNTVSNDFPGTIGGALPHGLAFRGTFVARMLDTLSVPAGTLQNAVVSFSPIRSTFVTTHPTTDCHYGTFKFSARLQNTGTHSLSQLAVAVTTLRTLRPMPGDPTNVNLLQNADGGPRGIGAVMTIPASGSYTDGVLAPGEFVDVSFEICLKGGGAFTFFVNVMGDSSD